VKCELCDTLSQKTLYTYELTKNVVVMTLAFISIQYVLVLCNSIGTPLDPKYIDVGKQLAIVLLCWNFSSLYNEFLMQVCSMKQSLCGNTPCIQML